MDSIHFKKDFNMKIFFFLFFTSFIPLLFIVPKLYYTYYHLRLLMMVCIVLIWFLLTVLQESSNLDAKFIVCIKIKNKNSKLVFVPTPPPPFWSKANFLFFNPSLKPSCFSDNFCFHICLSKPSFVQSPSHKLWADIYDWLWSIVFIH